MLQKKPKGTYRNIIAFSALVLFFAFHFTVNAQEITVVTEHIPPYQTIKSDGSVGGFSTEVLNEILKITGDSANIQVMPWARAYKEVLQTKNTLIYSLSRTKLREPLFSWIGGLLPLQVFVWGIEGKFDKPFESLDEIKTYVVAVSRSTSAGQYIFRKNFPLVYYSVNEEQTMKMLYRDRVDLLVGNETLFSTRAKNLDLNFSKMEKLFEIKELRATLHMAFNKNSDSALVERFRLAFKQVKSSGKLAELQNKWHIPTKQY